MARSHRQRLSFGVAQAASLIRRGLRIVPVVISVGSGDGNSSCRGRIAVPRFTIRRGSPGPRSLQRLARVRRGGIGAFQWLKPTRVARFVRPPTLSVMCGLAFVFHAAVLKPDFDLALG